MPETATERGLPGFALEMAAYYDKMPHLAGKVKGVVVSIPWKEGEKQHAGIRWGDARDRLTLAGNIPASGMEQTATAAYSCFKTLFRVGGDDSPWHISYYGGSTRGFEHAHPFGPNFGIRRWGLAEPIDKWDKKPGKRVYLDIRIEEAECSR